MVVLVEAVAHVVVSALVAAPGFSSVSISDNGLAISGTELESCWRAGACPGAEVLKRSLELLEPAVGVPNRSSSVLACQKLGLASWMLGL